MKKIDNILVCVDLSEYSLPTLESAVTIAGNTNAQIHVINVLNQRDISVATFVPPYYTGKIDVNKFVNDTMEKRKQEIDALIKDHFSDYQPSMVIHMKKGIPFEEILKTADGTQADLIVMGSKGRSNLSMTLFGSQAEKVFRHSKIPVFSIRSKLHKRS